MDETAYEKFPEFPDIKDPLETALAEAEKSAELVADRRAEPGLGRVADGCRPAGEPMVARDVYGSRLLLVAPFVYDGGATDHWYAWDIDLCWIAVVVGAGVFASAEEALREWCDAVGPAASGAALSSCPVGMTAPLLAPCLRTGPRICECNAQDCALLFLDTSRASRRRWCSMAACGARAKMTACWSRHPRTARATTRFSPSERDQHGKSSSSAERPSERQPV